MSATNTKRPDTGIRAGAYAVIELSPVPAGPAGWRLGPQRFVHLREPEPAALAVEAAIDQFLPGQSHHVDLAAMDGDEEAGIEGLDVSGKIMVGAWGGSAGRGGHGSFVPVSLNSRRGALGVTA